MWSGGLAEGLLKVDVFLILLILSKVATEGGPAEYRIPLIFGFNDA
jgi:hypothetical protein